MKPKSHTNIKRCTGCKRFRPIELFNKSPHTMDGLGHRCSDCRRGVQKPPSNEQRAEWYAANHLYVKQRNALRYRRNKIRARIQSGRSLPLDAAKLREAELDLLHNARRPLAHHCP